MLTKGHVKIYGEPGYGLMNKAQSNYGSDFITENGLAQFMQWYIKNENALGRNNTSVRNVVVVCHSDLLMNFCHDHLSKPELLKRGMEGGEEGFFKKVNNYCIQIQVVMPERSPVPHATPVMKEAEIQTLLDNYRRNATGKIQPTDETTPSMTPSMTESDEIAKLLSTYRNPTEQLPVAGGNKHKKTFKRSTKLNKHGVLLKIL